MTDELSGTEKYSGDIEGSFNGEFEMTLDFDEGKMEGEFKRGAFSVNVEGEVKERKIEAEGSVMGKNVKISGNVESDGSSANGEWEVSGFGSGTWEGTKI